MSNQYSFNKGDRVLVTVLSRGQTKYWVGTVMYQFSEGVVVEPETPQPGIISWFCATPECVTRL
jgi:hypothetical protein